MVLTNVQLDILKKLMRSSAQKGNLANAGLVLRDGEVIASAESLVVTNNDATAHSERMLVSKVGEMMKSNYTPGLTIVTVVEPCTMCMSACSQAGYRAIAYIIPAKRYVAQIGWMTDVRDVNKQVLAKGYSSPIELLHLSDYEEEFCIIFEEVMAHLLK